MTLCYLMYLNDVDINILYIYVNMYVMPFVLMNTLVSVLALWLCWQFVLSLNENEWILIEI